MSVDPDDDTPPAAPPVDRFDLEIVEFMLAWAPYGGPPPDECVPLFGMSRVRLYAQLRAILANDERRHLDEPDLALLARAAALVEGRPVKVAVSSLGHRVLRNGVWRWT